MIHKKILVGLLFSAILSFSAEAAVRVVATLPDLASIAREIGADKIKAESLAKGYQNPHFVDPKPSFILKLKRADLFVEAGLDLEIGWVPPLVENARNRDILQGGKGYVDASQGISLLHIPDSKVERSEGDIHVYGNPHYWTDPLNGIIIGRNILEGLKRVSPENTAYFEKNYADFAEKLKIRTAGWVKKLKPYEGTEIITYHDSWPYFEKRFGITAAGHLEPKPGIPPSPKHLAYLIRKMKSRDIELIVFSPYFSAKPVKSVAERTGARAVEIYPSVGGRSDLDTYFKVWDYNIEQLAGALEQVKGED